MRIDVNKHWPVYLDFGRAVSLSLQLYWTYHRLLHMRVAVKNHALPVYKKNRIASLLCIFESTILCFQRCIVMRLFYVSYKQVKHDFSQLRAYAIICGRFNITVNWDYLHAQNQDKLASVCLHRFSSIFESTIGINIHNKYTRPHGPISHFKLCKFSVQNERF